MARYSGKTVLVTGGGSGIGEAMSKRFAEEGGRVVLVDRDRESVEAVAALIRESGGSADACVLDIVDTSAVAEVLGGIGRVDVLVNNAGIASIGSLEETTAEEMDRVYRVNVKGAFNCLKAVVPGMKAAGSGVILNLASIASRLGLEDRFAYSMSKGALLSMTLSVARDYIKDGIRCNCICPARVHTPFVDSFLEKNFADRKEQVFETLEAFQPIGRMAKPEEIAGLAAYLCSDEAAFITGAAYDIDGGVMGMR